MNVMNYHLYANSTMMPQLMAEDTGASELRNPVIYLYIPYKPGWLDRLRDKFEKRRQERLERLNRRLRPMNPQAQF